jgi:hypothetical protein
VSGRGVDHDDVVRAHLVVERRRIVLSVLKVHDEPMSTETIACEVSIRETNAEPTDSRVNDVRIALQG